MNERLKRLTREIDLDDACNFSMRVEFGICCVARVERILTHPDVRNALAVGKAWLRGESTREELDAAANSARAAAVSHEGSGSIDGSGSGAATLSHAVAFALSGRALDAAEYAAYASVYFYASYAVTDPDAYREEHDWQIGKLRELAGIGERLCIPRRKTI